MKYFRLIFLGVLLLVTLASLSHTKCTAEEKNIEAEGVYIVKDKQKETPEEARNKAKMIAQCLAVEKAGVYVESYSKSKKMKLTADELLTISGEIVDIKETLFREIPLHDNSVKYIANIKVTVDTTNIIKRLNIEKEKIIELQKKNKHLEYEYNESVAEETRLKNFDEKELDRLYEIAISKDMPNGERDNAVNQILTINPAYKKGIVCGLQAKIYEEQGQYQKALEYDLLHVKYNPKNADAYYACALDYCNLHDLKKAYSYINDALKIEPGNFRFLEARMNIQRELET